MKYEKKKIFSLMLCVCLLLTQLSGVGFATENGSEEKTEPVTEAASTCTCEMRCTTDTVNAACPVCAAEGADLTACTGAEAETTTPTEAAKETETTKETEATKETEVTEAAGATEATLSETAKAVQTLIDALPAADEITAENANTVVEQLNAIDEAKCGLSDGELALLDFTRYDEAASSLKALNGETDAQMPKTVETVSNIAYLGTNGEQQICASATVLDSSTVSWSSGWYVVNSNVTISDRIEVSGNVYLILCDNCTLTASLGITVNSGNTLTIYAQSKSNDVGAADTTGKLIASSSSENAAAIGGVREDAGTISIYGGNITATHSTLYGAGIGGGGSGSGATTIVIKNATVTATGGTKSAGIGGGWNGKGGAITITNSEIRATGKDEAEDIGHGADISENTSAADTQTITGSTVYYSDGTTVIYDSNGTKWICSASDSTITAEKYGESETKATATVVAPTDLTYNGNAKTASVIYSGGWTLGTLTPTYGVNGNVNAGEVVASITLGGVTASVNYTIEAKDVAPTADNIAPTFGTPTYTLGSTTLSKNAWNWVIGNDVITVTIPITEQGSGISGTDAITVTLTADSLARASVQAGDITLTRSMTDGYMLSFTIPVGFAGAYQIIVMNTAGYEGTYSSETDLTVDGGVMAEQSKPEITVTLDGTAVSGVENAYSGEAKFTITAKDLEEPASGLKSLSYTLNGTETTLTQDVWSTQKTESYTSDAVTVSTRGAYTLIVTLTDNAGNTQTETVNFTVYTEPIARLVTVSSVTYDGSPVAAGTDFILLKTGSDGAVTYSYRAAGSTDSFTTGLPTNAGTWEIMASIAQDDTGYYLPATATATMTIEPKDLDSLSITVTVSPSKTTVTGKTITPTVTVKDGNTVLTEGVDYTLSGDTSASVKGKYTITITGKGNYTGTTTAKWRLKAATSNASTGDTSAVALWLALLAASCIGFVLVIVLRVRYRSKQSR